MNARWHTLVQLLTLLLLGLMAGFFFAFAFDVVPATLQLDAEHYVLTQQAINRVVRNVVFGMVYFGSAVFPFILSWSYYQRKTLLYAKAWLIVALIYFVMVFVLTRWVNVPINQEMADWNPNLPPENWQVLRDRWNMSNYIRTAAATMCFIAGLFLTIRISTQNAYANSSLNN
ncbi:DUF1772 domain-containing protein [Parvibium lacunae]|nr:DUF1772 domain-containing protein [Parvibium lacunae]